MLQKDYVLRMIEKAGQALARILAKKQVKKYDEAQSEVQLAFNSLLGLDYHLVKGLAPDDLMMILQMDGQPDPGKCIAAADLLKEDAEIKTMTGSEPESFSSDCLALFLYAQLYGYRDDKYDLNLEKKIAEILSRTADLRLPGYVVRSLVAYHEAAGAFALAEDLLYDLKADDEPGTDAFGRAFYRRLLEKKDDELIRGDLPRDEVEDGLREWEEEMI